MSDERLAAIEARIATFESTVETRSIGRDSQISALAVELGKFKGGTAVLAGLLGFVALGGAGLMTFVQQRQDDKLAIVQAQIDATAEKIVQDRFDLRFLDSQLRIQDRDFRGGLSAVEARMQMLEKQVDAMDMNGSRRWVKK